MSTQKVVSLFSEPVTGSGEDLPLVFCFLFNPTPGDPGRAVSVSSEGELLEYSRALSKEDAMRITGYVESESAPPKVFEKYRGWLKDRHPGVLGLRLEWVYLPESHVGLNKALDLGMEDPCG